MDGQYDQHHPAAGDGRLDRRLRRSSSGSASSPATSIGRSVRVLGWLAAAVMVAALLHPAVAGAVERRAARRRPRAGRRGRPSRPSAAWPTPRSTTSATRRPSCRRRRPKRRGASSAASASGNAAREFGLTERVDRAREGAAVAGDRWRPATQSITAAATRGFAYVAGIVLTVFLLLYGPRHRSRAAAPARRRHPPGQRRAASSAAGYERWWRYVVLNLAARAVVGISGTWPAGVIGLPGAFVARRSPLGVVLLGAVPGGARREPADRAARPRPRAEQPAVRRVARGVRRLPAVRGVRRPAPTRPAQHPDRPGAARSWWPWWPSSSTASAVRCTAWPWRCSSSPCSTSWRPTDADTVDLAELEKPAPLACARHGTGEGVHPNRRRRHDRAPVRRAGAARTASCPPPTAPSTRRRRSSAWRAPRPVPAPSWRTSSSRIERDLYVLMAELATLPENRRKLKPGVAAVTAAMVERLERLIDATSERFEPPTEFVVPGRDEGGGAARRGPHRRAPGRAPRPRRRRAAVARRDLPEPPVRSARGPSPVGRRVTRCRPASRKGPMAITFDTAVTRPRTADVVGIPITTDGPVPRGAVTRRGARRARLPRQARHHRGGARSGLRRRGRPRQPSRRPSLRTAAAALARAVGPASAWWPPRWPTSTASIRGRRPRPSPRASSLGSYRYLELKRKADAVGARAGRAARTGRLGSGARPPAPSGARAIAGAVSFGRDLANTPPGHLTARDLAGPRRGRGPPARPRGRGARRGRHHRALRPRRLLGVNQGSTEPPRLVKLTYTPRRPAGHASPSWARASPTTRVASR